MPIACATQSCWMMHCYSLNEPLSVLPKAWMLHKFLKPSISLPCKTGAAVGSLLKLFGASFFAFVFLSSSFCNNMVQVIVRLERKIPRATPLVRAVNRTMSAEELLCNWYLPALNCLLLADFSVLSPGRRWVCCCGCLSHLPSPKWVRACRREGRLLQAEPIMVSQILSLLLL